MLIEMNENETIVRRFEDAKHGRDTECVIHYLCALYATSQLERAAKFVLAASGTSTGGGGGMTAPLPFTLLGTKDRPLHVVNDGASSGGGGWGRRLSTLMNVVIVGAIMYSVFAMNEHKLGGISST